MSDNEENTLAGRVARYARVSGAMGGIAARMAGERYLGLKVERGKAAEDLKSALGGLKGPLMKVAQLLATIPDAVPKEYVHELSQLQSNAPAMGWPFVKRRMANELGPKWQSRFGEFEKEACAAASLGQVHRATTPDGEALACKLQYPDMQSAVEADLKQLKLILGIFERSDKAISTKQIHAEISERLREELDYTREAKHMAMYRDVFADDDRVFVPDVHHDLTTKRLLTMSWLEGDRILNFVDSHEELRNKLAMNMFYTWYIPFYNYGLIHGDPHLGNYQVREDGSINLLDFGCIRVFPAHFVRGVIDLYNALKDDDPDLAVHAYETWGFENLTKELIDVLNIWANFIYAPILEDRTRLIEETNSGMYGRETARKVHMALREVGGVEVPREFVFMDRAAIGLGSVFLHLKANINWYELFQSVIKDFDEDSLRQRQSQLLAANDLPPVEAA
ncbi:MAG: AarF/ABC1/UbiB kinase family protein [Alphaproteobacteria bacterium]|nr:AarF/ABC1/UbiB kinase family protein [Alphaproteobacteria bacterium SS10]